MEHNVSKATHLQLTEDRNYRAIVFRIENGGLKRVDAVAEATDLSDLRAWFLENCEGVDAVTDACATEFDYPDCLTVWEAAEICLKTVD